MFCVVLAGAEGCGPGGRSIGKPHGVAVSAQHRAVQEVAAAPAIAYVRPGFWVG
jgi:hypothetical protein